MSKWCECLKREVETCDCPAALPPLAGEVDDLIAELDARALWDSWEIYGKAADALQSLSARLAECERERDEARAKAVHNEEQWVRTADYAEKLEDQIASTTARAALSDSPAPAGGDDGWRDIASAPKDGTVIQAYHVVWKSPKSVLWRDPVDGCPWLETGYTVAWPAEAFSHWRPLPAPPAKGARDE